MNLEALYEDKQFMLYISQFRKFSENLLGVVKEIAEHNVQYTSDRLTAERNAVDDRPFAPLTPNYLDWKVRTYNEYRIGLRTHNMKNELSYEIDDNRSSLPYDQVGGGGITATIGTTAKENGFPYPAAFHYGDYKVPARPFVGFDNYETDKIFKRITKLAEEGK